jgi:2,3-bisphosphoglycerate-independent phosphoglycerate mutase
MDRDNRWERVERAYNAMIKGEGLSAVSAGAAVAEAYARGETDEFILPTVIGGFGGAKDGDGFFCLNFRADRAREILLAVGEDAFKGFDRGIRPHWEALLGMVDYSQTHDAFMAAAYPKRPVVNTIGAWVASKGLRQFRLAETEKYPHVTFFFNGGEERQFPGEDRILVASPKVATYDLQPEMSAPELCDKLVAAIDSGKYDLVVVNFANPDMVGHTGILAAAIKACATVDGCLGKIEAAVRRQGGAMIVTADHGNAELMRDPQTGGPHTAHTLNKVPVILVNAPGSQAGGPRRRLHDGKLADVAPTLLALMGLKQPAEMTGRSLIDAP